MNKYINHFTINDTMIFLSIFILLYVNSSYNLVIISGSFSLILSFICALTVSFISSRLKIKISTILPFIMLSNIVLISSIINGDNIKNIIIMIFSLFISSIFVCSVDFKKYMLVYRNVILILASFSLIVYIIAIVTPNIIRLFPQGYYRPSFEVYNLGLAFINLKPSLLRNMSIFWEPGAYQTYLNFAILLELFSEDCRKYAIVIFFISLITTFSTTAYINLILFLIILILGRNKNKLNNIFEKVIKLVSILVILFIIYNNLPDNIQYAIFGKITTYFESNKESITSASVRFDSIKYPIVAFFESPLFGKSYSGISNYMLLNGNSMMTCTPINWFSTYGIFYGGLLLSGMWCFSSILCRKNIYLKFLTFISLLICISTEQYLRNITILIFIFYGISHWKIFIKRKKYN